MRTHLFIFTFRWYNWLDSDWENNDLNFYIFLCKSNIIFEAFMSFCRVLEFIYQFMCLWHTFDFMVTDRNSIKDLSTSLQWNRGLPRKGFDSLLELLTWWELWSLIVGLWIELLVSYSYFFSILSYFSIIAFAQFASFPLFVGRH